MRGRNIISKQGGLFYLNANKNILPACAIPMTKAENEI